MFISLGIEKFLEINYEKIFYLHRYLGTNILHACAYWYVLVIEIYKLKQAYMNLKYLGLIPNQHKYARL